MLLGVNIGPNLTYTGSLATLLWRRILQHHESSPDLGEFTRLGLLTVPAGLVIGVLALWAGLFPRRHITLPRRIPKSRNPDTAG